MRFSMMYSSIPMILAHIVLFSSLICVVTKRDTKKRSMAKSLSRKAKLRTAIDSLNWKKSSGTFDGNLKTEIVVLECEGQIGSATVRNALLESQISGKDARIRSLARDEKFLIKCQKNFKLYEKHFAKMGPDSSRRKGGEKCQATDLESEVRNMNSSILNELQKDNGDVLKYYKRLVQKIAKDSNGNTQENKNCKKMKKMTDRILNIFEANGFPTENIQKLMKELLAGGCLRKRRYVVIKENTPWQEATIKCEKKHMRHAVVRNDQDTMDIVTALRDSVTEYATVGGLEVDNKWTWITEPMNYTNWAKNQPLANKGRSCLWVDARIKAQWYPNDCNLTVPYVCEAFADF